MQRWLGTIIIRQINFIHISVPSYDALLLKKLCISFYIVGWEMKNLNENNFWSLFESRNKLEN